MNTSSEPVQTGAPKYARDGGGGGSVHDRELIEYSRLTETDAPSWMNAPSPVHVSAGLPETNTTSAAGGECAQGASFVRLRLAIVGRTKPSPR